MVLFLGCAIEVHLHVPLGRILTMLGYTDSLSTASNTLSVLAPINSAWDDTSRALNMSTTALINSL